MLIFDADGHYGLLLSRKDVPKFASDSRTNGTTKTKLCRERYRTFGEYVVSGSDITFKINVSTYPNFNGTE